MGGVKMRNGWGRVGSGVFWLLVAMGFKFGLKNFYV